MKFKFFSKLQFDNFFLEAPLDSFSERGLSKMSFIKAEVRNKLDEIQTAEGKSQKLT